MKIKVGASSCGIAAGADRLIEILESDYSNISTEITGCIGLCYLEPIIDIYDEDDNLWLFLV